MYQNLVAALDGEALQTFEPGGDYLLIYNLGNGTGIFRKKRPVFNGGLVYSIKDFMDRKFIKRFPSVE